MPKMIYYTRKLQGSKLALRFSWGKYAISKKKIIAAHFTQDYRKSMIDCKHTQIFFCFKQRSLIKQQLTLDYTKLQGIFMERFSALMKNL